MIDWRWFKARQQGPYSWRKAGSIHSVSSVSWKKITFVCLHWNLYEDLKWSDFVPNYSKNDHRCNFEIRNNIPFRRNTRYAYTYIKSCHSLKTLVLHIHKIFDYFLSHIIYYITHESKITQGTLEIKQLQIVWVPLDGEREIMRFCNEVTSPYSMTLDVARM